MSSANTRICKFFMRGYCWFGDRCWYSHDLSTLGAASAVVIQPATQRQPLQPKKPSNMLNTTPNQVKKDDNLSGQSATENSPPDTVEQENANPPASGAAQQDLTAVTHSNFVTTIQRAFENDLQCHICYEIFIKPMVLNCTHTFCETCIQIWTRRVNRCPVCRLSIKSKAHCLTLNVFIEKMIQYMPEDVIIRRNLSIKERNKDREEMINSRNRMYRGNRIGVDRPIETLDYFSENHDEVIETEVTIQEAEMYRMNLHDTVVSTGGLNPLIRYMIPVREHHL